MKNSKIYTKTTAINFAKFAREYDQADLYELFDHFIETQQDMDIFNRVLYAACEMNNVSIREMQGRHRYGNIPITKQMTSRILSELGYHESDIAMNLKELGTRSTIYSQIRTSKNDEETNVNYARILNQLRERFSLT